MEKMKKSPEDEELGCYNDIVRITKLLREMGYYLRSRTNTGFEYMKNNGALIVSVEFVDDDIQTLKSIQFKMNKEKENVEK